MIIEAEFECAFCITVNATTVDPSAGRMQEYVEDCQICCRPNLLHIEVDAEGGSARIEAEQE